MDGGRRQLVGIDLTIVIGPSGWPIICKESIVTPTLRGERTNFSSLASNGIRADASTDIEEGGGICKNSSRRHAVLLHACIDHGSILRGETSRDFLMMQICQITRS